MAVSTDSALVRFTIGDFSEPTTLTIPTEAEENKLTLRITEEISSQLSGWGDSPIDIYILLDVKFNGEDWYTNSEYSSFSSSVAPTDPDLTIDVDNSSGIVESVTVNNYVPLVKDTSGNIVNGTYTVNAKFVYWAFDTAFAGSITTFSAPLNYEKLLPLPNYSYDTSSDNPFLKLSDNQNYIVNGVTPEIEEEFVLYPPQNMAEITTVTSNQTIKFTSFWTGGNELKLTTLLTYTLPTYEIITLQEAYDSFTLYNVDNCAIFSCLNNLYNKYVASTCGTKQNAIYNQQLIEATAIAMQIYSGRGCNQPTLTELLSDFEELCGCSCNCVDDEVVNIGAPNVVLQSAIQTVQATTDTTEIDLSEGSTVFLNLAVNAGTTEVQVSNITQYATYRFIVTRAFSTQAATFETGVFFDAEGDIPTVEPTLANKVVLEFFATTSSTLTLTNWNIIDTASGGVQTVSGTMNQIDIDDSDPENLVASLPSVVTNSLALADTALQNQFVDLGDKSYAADLDLSTGNVFFINSLQNYIELTASNYVEGDYLRVVIRSDVDEPVEVIFTSPDFTTYSSTTIPNGATSDNPLRGFSFLACNATGTSAVSFSPLSDSIGQDYSLITSAGVSGTYAVDVRNYDTFNLSGASGVTLGLSQAIAGKQITISFNNTDGSSQDITFTTPSASVPTVYDGASASPTITVPAGAYAVLRIMILSDRTKAVIVSKNGI